MAFWSYWIRTNETMISTSFLKINKNEKMEERLYREMKVWEIEKEGCGMKGEDKTFRREMAFLVPISVNNEWQWHTEIL